jgi:hypothetical protein
LSFLFAQSKVAAQEVLRNSISFEETPPLPPADTIVTLPADTILTLPTDTIVAAPDSTKSNAIDAPIHYAAKDSMIMTMDGHNMLYLFGEGSVKYKNLDLTGEYIEIDADSSIVYTTFELDSIGNEFGYPIFKEGESQYEMKKARYNFKTKKMYITDVITQQGEGYVTAGETKKMANDDLFMRNGKYTTCDDHDHPHFYIQLTKAKVQPGKRIITGPAYLVMEDVPLPVAIPFGFFPFSHEYSSGVIMPTYGDEMNRGFSLREGGYYFAFNDYMDLALTGEIYTKGSWGLDARSRYNKRYKFSGNFNTSFRETINGDKEDPDYSKSKDFKIMWTHQQDPKANPFSTLSASVNLSTSSYNKNDLNSMYSGAYTQNEKSSSINYSYRPPGSPFSFSANTSVSQVSKTQSLSVTLPNFTATMSDVYPFRRKEQVGAPRWYENIRMSYSGLFTNSISTKEDSIFKKSLLKDWRNGARHNIPISASFNLLKYITITPAVNYSELWYTSRIDRGYDYVTDREIPLDTVYGFNRLYNYNASVSASTKLYGMYQPMGIFGSKIRKIQIRHVMTPSVSFSGAPDFSDKKYGYYKDLTYYNKSTGKMEVKTYSPYAHQLWGAPGAGRSGTMSFSLDNNLEMKLPVGEADSTRKVSLIDNLQLGSGYNFLADSLNWSVIHASLRLKLGRSSLSLQGNFDPYLYDENGRNINVLRIKSGKGIGRFMGTSSGYSYTFNNDVIKNWFSKSKDEKDSEAKGKETSSEEGESTTSDTGEESGKKKSLRKEKKNDSAEYDDDGYFLAKVPWSLSFNYSISMSYDTQNFNKTTREYPYRINQTLGISGNITPTKGWSFNFSSSYDFDTKKFATMNCSINRQMHCWSMSASFIPVGPYQSYYFSIAVNSSMLSDLKYTQSNSFRDSMNWGD